MSNKKPADHKKKATAIDRLRAEFGGIDIPVGELEISGRNGKVTVTLLDPFDWTAEAVTCLRENDYFSAIIGMVSESDAAKLRAVQPTLGSLFEALLENPEPDADDVGESQAS